MEKTPATTESPRQEPPRHRLPLALIVVFVVLVVGVGWWILGSRGPASSPAASAPADGTPVVVAQTANDSNGSGTFRDHVNGLDPGPRIDAGATIEVSCRGEGLPVGNGNAWWYRVSTPPWDDDWWTAADNFYNGATSGPLANTPFVDETIPLC